MENSWTFVVASIFHNIDWYASRHLIIKAGNPFLFWEPSDQPSIQAVAAQYLKGPINNPGLRFAINIDLIQARDKTFLVFMSRHVSIIEFTMANVVPPHKFNSKSLRTHIAFSSMCIRDLCPATLSTRHSTSTLTNLSRLVCGSEELSVCLYRSRADKRCIQRHMQCLVHTEC